MNRDKTLKSYQRSRPVKILETERDSFLKEFDPGKSNRERRKRSARMVRLKEELAKEYRQRQIEDEQRLIRPRLRNFEPCDSMDSACDVCLLPCPDCANYNCGLLCKIDKKFMYECYEIQRTLRKVYEFLRIN